LVKLVAIQVSLLGLYLAPVSTVLADKSLLRPPHTIISTPVQMAECKERLAGTFATVIGLQVSVAGLYLAPVFKVVLPTLSPPHTIISLPVQIAV
jgi:hypothetical protein